MNEKTNQVFSLEDESTTVTIFSFITKKYSIGNADLSGAQSFFSNKHIGLNFVRLYGLKMPILISENAELSTYLRQVYSL